MEPTFDKDGYPTQETLDAIEKWPIATFADVKELFVYIEKAWKYHDWGWHAAKRRTRESWKGAPLRRKLQISTGGWSGNEDLISALQRNFVAWNLSWMSTRRGGHYVFEVREK